MVPYLSIFFISIVVCAAGERALRTSRAAGMLLCYASVLFPVFLAGARAYTVGTDVITYGNYVFDYACRADSLYECVRALREIEPLYKALAYAVSRFTNNPHWFYFMTALIICTLTMAGLWYYRQWCSITISWACFLFLFYGETLNVMRQCLALAVLFAAFPFFLEKKYALFAIFSVAAVAFHVTGIIALSLPLIYLFMKEIPPRWLQFFLIIAFIAVILLYSPLVSLVIQMKLLPAKFSRYIAAGIAFALKPTLLRLPFLVPIIMYYDRFCLSREIPGGTVLSPFTADEAHAAEDVCGNASRTREEKIDLYTFGMFTVLMLLLEICTIQLRSVRPALYRISYYFGYYKFIAYSHLVRILRRDNRVIVTVILIIYLAAVWYYQNVIQGNNQIYPYVYSPGWFEPHIPILLE